MQQWQQTPETSTWKAEVGDLRPAWATCRDSISKRKRCWRRLRRKDSKTLWWKWKWVHPYYPVQNTELFCREPEIELPDCLTIPGTYPQDMSTTALLMATETWSQQKLCVSLPPLWQNTCNEQCRKKKNGPCGLGFQKFQGMGFTPDMKPDVTA